MKVKAGGKKGKREGNREWGMRDRKLAFLPLIPHSLFPSPYSLLRNFLTLSWQSGVCRAMTFKSTPARSACSKLIESI
jgi:hypothetical protein